MTAHGYVPPEYLAAAEELVRGAKARSHERMGVGEGDAVLDVGCGTGADTVALAERVGPSGRVVGMDHDAEMLERARQRAEAAGVAGRVEHLRGDALALPFRDGEFAATRSERLFQHLSAPERALAEMARVTRPGGRVVVMDTDWGSRSVDAPEPALERRMASVLAGLLANAYSGRRLRGMFVRQGLAELEVEVFPTCVTGYGLWRLLSRMEMAEAEAVRSGVMSPDEVRRLDEGLRAIDAEGAFFAVTNLVLVSGRRG